MQNSRRNRIAVIFGLFLFGAPSGVLADDFVGSFDDWHVQTYEERGKKVCLMWSQPKKDQGDYTKRGDIYAYVTQRPASKRFDEISISIGYSFKKDSSLEVTIRDQTFSLFTDGDTAWNRSPDEDKKMVAAMKAGLTMIGKGTSSRGTETIDTYSLRGFTAAYKAMNEACGIK